MRNAGKIGLGSEVRRVKKRPRLELLEGRALFSTIVVNTTGDAVDPSGGTTVSLRDAPAAC
jgi:hypothetical protein